MKRRFPFNWRHVASSLLTSSLFRPPLPFSSLAPLTFTFDLRNESMVFEFERVIERRSRETCIDRSSILLLFIFFFSQMKMITSFIFKIFLRDMVYGVAMFASWNYYFIDRVVVCYNSRNWRIIFLTKRFHFR